MTRQLANQIIFYVVNVDSTNVQKHMFTSHLINKLEPEHLNVIKMLVDEVHRPVEEVKGIYTQTFENLNSEARIKDYLIVLTCKKVRDELH